MERATPEHPERGVDDTHLRWRRPDERVAWKKAGDLLGLLDPRVKGDLQRFKEFIEARGRESGAWRGEVGQDPTS